MSNAKTVLITGGTGGLGVTVSSMLASAGHRLIYGHGRSVPELREGDLAIAVNLTDARGPGDFVASAIERAGKIDALVNLAGGYESANLAETSDDVWTKMIELNAASAFRLMRAVIPHLVANRRGTIVHVGSQAALEPYAGAAAYIASKAALVSLVRSAALELEGTGVSAHVLLPSVIDTPQSRASMPDADRRDWTTPEELGRQILHFLENPGAE